MVVLAVMILAMMVLAGCAAVREPAELREAALKGSANEIVIGVVWPFASRNDQFREGLHLALGLVNEQGLLGGKQLRLIEEDDEGSATVGMAIARQFAEDKSISAVIGHRSSAVTIPAARIYAHAGIVLLSPASTSPKLTDDNSGYVFRNIPSDDQFGQALALHAADSGANKVAIYYANDEYGKGLANAFEDQARLSGLQVVDRVAGYKDAADVRRIAAKWEALGSELVLVSATAAEGIAFIKELREAGYEQPVIGGDGLDSADFAAAGPFVQGSVVASVYNPLRASGATEQFRKRFIATYGSEPGKWAAQAYDTLLLLAEAIEQAGSRSPRAIARGLEAIEGWEGAAGARSFSSSGDVQQMEVVMKMLRNGEFGYIGN